jgi:hypothetical protein
MEEAKVNLSEDDKSLLIHVVQKNSHKRIIEKARSLLLMDQGYDDSEIEELLYITKWDLRACRINYLKRGVKYIIENDTRNRYDISFFVRQHGIDLCFELIKLSIKISCSSIFDPFPDLMKWILDIYNGKEVSFIQIDEEGHFKDIFFTKLPGCDDDLFELKIISSGWQYDECEIKKVVSKKGFLIKFGLALKKLADENKELKWVCHDGLSGFIYESIRPLMDFIEEENKLQ